MSFREELKNIVAESNNIVYTQSELDNFRAIVKYKCKLQAAKGLDECLIPNREFSTFRDGRNITPTKHHQIMAMIAQLELNVRYIDGISQCYEISWRDNPKKSNV